MNDVTRLMTNNTVSSLTIYTGGTGVSLGKSTPVDVAGEAVLTGGTGGSLAHTHPNKFILDGLDVNSEDLLKYYTNDLNIPLTQEDW